MKDLNKIRIRSDDELRMQNLGLKELSQILNKKEIKHYITGGTLLGAIREKNFIKWDWDVEITVLTDQIFNIKDEFSDLFLKSNFQVSKYVDKYDSLKWKLTKYNCTYEIMGYYREGKWMYRLGKDYKVPADFFDKPSDLFFLGNLYKTVSEPKKYLDFCYGNWQIPIRSTNKKRYLTLSHRPGFKIHNIIFQKIKNSLVKFKKMIITKDKF